MTTKLKKTVEREITDWCQKGAFGLGGQSSKRNLIVAMEVGNVFSFREKGRRKKFVIDMETVYNLAVKAEVMGLEKENGSKKKSRKVKRYGW